MSGLKNFAVAGAGSLGQHVVKALLQLKATDTVTVVRILTRNSASKSAELVSLGATLAEVNYDDPTSLKSALSDIDVVISTLGAQALDKQTRLADSSLAAGVQLFVPSEFGGNIDGNMDHPIFATKNMLKDHLRDMGLPFVSFSTGLFPDFVLQSAFNFDFKNGHVTFGGSGDVPISWTSMPDIGRFIAYVLTTLPKAETEWRSFRIEGDRQSFNSIISAYEQRSGTKIRVKKQTCDELKSVLKNNPFDFVSFLFLYCEGGGGVSGNPEEILMSEGLWPDWNPKKATDVALEMNE